MSLSDAELKALIEKATNLLLTDDPSETVGEERKRREEIVRCMDTVIANSLPVAHYFFLRFLARRQLGRYDALEDINQAIILDPDRPKYHVYRARSIFEQEHRKTNSEILNDINVFNEQAKREIWKKFIKTIPQVQEDFEAALHSDPTLPEVWLGVIACALLLGNWDEAISLCGESRPFITDPTDQANRAWYLCLALTFAGDIVTEEEKKNIEGAIISQGDWNRMLSSTREVGELVLEHLSKLVKEMGEESIQQKQYKIEVIDILVKPATFLYSEHLPRLGDQNIGELLILKAELLCSLGRYDEELEAWLMVTKLISSYPGNWLKLSNCLGRLSRYSEGLGAINNMVQNNWHYKGFTSMSVFSSQIWLEKGIHFEGMNRYKEALQAYTKAAEPNPGDYYSENLPGNNRYAPDALNKKYSLLLKLRRFQEGLEVVDHLFSLWPDLVTIEQIDEIIGKNPAKDRRVLSRAFFQKARILSFNGDHENAEYFLSKAIELDPRICQLVANEELLKDLLPSDVMNTEQTQKQRFVKRLFGLSRRE